MEQSLNAVKIDGVISIIGFLGGGADNQPSFLDVLSHVCLVRGIYVGSRVQFEEMVSSDVYGCERHGRADNKTESSH